MLTLYLLLLVIAYGACVGSFLNVVAYRLPLGRSLVQPGSHCPQCDKPIAWYDNIPVLSWLLLRGRCRRCGTSISVRYPLVEATTAALFGGLFYAYYMSGLCPTWQQPGVLATWPLLVVHLTLLGCLIAATLIDAEHFIIPLSIPYLAVGVAVVLLPTAAALGWMEQPAMAGALPPLGDMLVALGLGALIDPQPPMPTLPAGGIFATVLAAGGLVASLILLRLKVIPHSFMEEQFVEAEADPVGPRQASADEARPDRGLPGWLLAGGVIGSVLAIALGGPWGLFAAIVVLMLVILPASIDRQRRVTHDEMEKIIYHPHPRREVCKELLFLALPVAGLIAGWTLGQRTATAVSYPVAVLGAVGLGYFAAAGTIWAVRILGTLAFGKEAMGLGDAHLWGAVGAVLGPLDPFIGFFIAPFLGLAAVAISTGVAAIVKGRVRVIPYGPFLAAAAVAMMAFRRPILSFLGIL